MKFFLWENVLIDYTDGVMFAFAESLEEAKAQLLKECNYVPDKDLNSPCKVFELSEIKPFGLVLWGGG